MFGVCVCLVCVCVCVRACVVACCVCAHHVHVITGPYLQGSCLSICISMLNFYCACDTISYVAIT